MNTVTAYQINNTNLYMNESPVRETEKAAQYYVGGASGYKAFWIPKSLIKFDGKGFIIPDWFVNKEFGSVKG